MRDLTDEVVTRTMDSLRATLSTRELSALEELVRAGTFLDPKALLSAIKVVEDTE